MLKKDFTRRRYFPGTHGNPFDKILRFIDWIETIPAPLFAALLFGLALLPLSFSLSLSFCVPLILWLFFLGDWALLASLPRARKSFGPAKPPTVMLAVLRLIPAALPLPLLLAAQVLGTALVVYGFWIEPQRLTVTRQSLRSPKLSLARPLRLLHLGDLHMERITARDRKMVALTRELAPDVILFSGDFLNLSRLRDPEAWEAARTILRELHAPLGVFAVTGSPAVDLDDVVPQLLDGLANLRWLRDEKITLAFQGQPIDIVGLSCTHKPFVDDPRLRSILAADPEGLRDLRGLDHFTILLYHSPDLAPEAAGAGIDLQLSGHTHGGQVRLPLYGALYAGSLYGKRFEAGRKRVGAMTLYVTRGLGLEGKGAPRVRFLCPPEVILWEIEGRASGA
jgi:predicted MPP superfamily phosphohydrolase